MDDEIQFKVYALWGTNVETEVRRFFINKNMMSNFNHFRVKLQSVFSALEGKTYNLTWKDEDNDHITISSDVEYEVALNSMSVPKFYVHCKENQKAKCKTPLNGNALDNIVKAHDIKTVMDIYEDDYVQRKRMRKMCETDDRDDNERPFKRVCPIKERNVEVPLSSPNIIFQAELEDRPMSVICEYLGGIKNELKELKEIQDNILLKLSTITHENSPLHEIDLPLTDFKDILKMEACLQNKEFKQKLINSLGLIGGDKTKTITKKILKRVFKNTLATKCNWTGKNNKTSVKDLHLMPVILAAVRKNSVAESARNFEIIDVIIKWFQFYNDRDEERNKRRPTTSVTSMLHSTKKEETVKVVQ